MEVPLVGLRGLSGLAASGALHVLVAVIMPRASIQSAPLAAPTSVEVSFVSQPEEPVLEPTPEEPMPAPEEPEPRSPRPEVVVRPPPVTRPPVSPAPPAAPSSTPRPTAFPGFPHRARPASRPGLDPRAVALSGYTPPGHTPGPSTPAETDVEPSEQERREAAAAALDSHLAQANHVPGERRRPPPHLLRRSDGGFLWRGSGISARILPDGEVRFSDRPGFAYDGDNPGGSPLPSVSFRFDITDALERSQGNDPYYADRRWFMHQTRELRQRLAARSDAERGTHEDRRLLGRLRRIAQDESLTLAARHRAIFQTFRDCADDERGERARRQILRFVHDELPEGSAEGFTRREIDALNAGRAQRFEPYR